MKYLSTGIIENPYHLEDINLIFMLECNKFSSKNYDKPLDDVACTV